MFHNTDEGSDGWRAAEQLREDVASREARMESLRATVDRLESELRDYKTLCRIAFSIVGKSPCMQKAIAEDTYKTFADQDELPNTRDFLRSLLRIAQG